MTIQRTDVVVVVLVDLHRYILDTDQNQNQNSLLVKRQTDNTTPRGWGLTGGD